MNLINWIGCHYDVTSTVEQDPPTENNAIDFVKGFAEPFLLKQAHAILNYKCKAEALKLSGVPNCQAEDVQCQLELLLPAENVYGPVRFGLADLSDCDSFVFGDFRWRVSEKVSPIAFQGAYYFKFAALIVLTFFSEVDPENLGTTKGDTMFMDGTIAAFPLTKGAVSQDTVGDENAAGETPEEEEGADNEPLRK